MLQCVTRVHINFDNNKLPFKSKKIKFSRVSYKLPLDKINLIRDKQNTFSMGERGLKVNTF